MFWDDDNKKIDEWKKAKKLLNEGDYEKALKALNEFRGTWWEKLDVVQVP